MVMMAGTQRAVLLVVVVVVGPSLGQHLATVMLKQAADTLLQSPFASSAAAAGSGLARIELPAAEDLLIRRLQGELSLRVEDNWRSIKDPQRYQILQSKGAATQILKSFVLLNTKMLELERDTNIHAVEKILNNLNVGKDEMQNWLRVWDDLRRKVGQIAQLYNYFRGYVNNPDNTEAAVLQDFASSITQSSVQDREMRNMLISFHEAVVSGDSQSSDLFPYLNSLLSKVTKV